jgi:hypothetical protein
MNKMIKILWTDSARKYFLREPANIEVSPKEVMARIQFAQKQAKEWAKSAVKIALDDNGLEYYACAIQQTKQWQEQANILSDLLRG